MKAKDLARASVGVGTAALLGLTAPACGCGSTTPQAEETPATQAETAQPTESTESADEGAVETQGQQEAPSETSGEQGEVAQESEDQPEQAGPDCTGSNQFSEECGYASPSRYAVLNPRRIVNS